MGRVIQFPDKRTLCFRVVESHEPAGVTVHADNDPPRARDASPPFSLVDFAEAMDDWAKAWRVA